MKILENLMMSVEYMDESSCLLLNKSAELRGTANEDFWEEFTNTILDSNFRIKSIICNFSELKNSELTPFKTLCSDLFSSLSKHKRVKYIASIISKDSEIQNHIKLALRGGLSHNIVTLHFSDTNKAALWAQTIK